MKTILSFLFCLHLFALTILYSQQFVLVHPVVKSIQKDYQEKRITLDEKILYQFFHLFDPSRLPARYHIEENYIAKCGTMIFVDYVNQKEKLDLRTIEIIEAYLQKERRSTEAMIYISPSGKFELTYDTTGTNAVPKTDQNGNGIPDFIERAAIYCDSSWYVEIDSIGFIPPPINPPTTRYKISFEAMDYYGYTTPYGTNYGTRIVLNSTFLGFPPNTDPDGNQYGAMKVTIAHEFKHASQYKTSRWYENDWVEVDATWAEDIVFDQTNDYYNYLTDPDSPLMAPGNSLDGDGSGGSYEDCIWQHYMSQKHGNAIIRSFWLRRAAKLNTESVLNSYDTVFTAYGSSLAKGFAEFTAWNYMTGSRAVSGFGYDEAAFYPTSALCRTHTILPASGSQCTLNHLAANFIHLTPSSSDSVLTISFNGQNTVGLALNLVTQTITGNVQYTPVILDANNDASYRLPIRTKNIQFAGLIPAVTHKTGTGYTFNYTIDKTPGIVVSHSPLSGVQDSTGPYPVSAIIHSFNESIDPGKTKIIYWTSAVTDSVPLGLTSGDTLYTGMIPSLGNYIVVRYYLQITDSSGYKVSLPQGAPVNYYEFSIGADVIPPVLSMLPYPRIPVAREFPLTLKTILRDDSGIDSASLNWRINSSWMPSIPLIAGVNDTFTAILNPDTSLLQAGDTLTVGIIATDGSPFHNQSSSGEHQLIFGKEFTLLRNLSKSIPDNNTTGVFDTLELTATEVFPPLTVADVDVIFMAIHPLVGDLSVSLISPGGITKNIVHRPGPGTVGSSGDNPDIILDDDAATSIEDITFTGTQLVTGTYRPYPDTLRSYNGSGITGRWIMKVSDLRATNTGTWTRWGLRIRSISNSVALSVPESSVPAAWILYPNYPNPFNPSTTIRYYLPYRSHISLKIYNLLGQEVRTLFSGMQQAGPHQIMWDAKDNYGHIVASGVYFYRLQSPEFISTRKMLLLK